ncbi:Putative Pumilio-family RNA binding repeat domain protein [Aspergillus calidoustus]|uniref:Putative Pumilio-family RNA binding repeat domain protein n=1 Tax=Aspergillus calidoustus TaxID=454130 RepID=A0A0U5GMN5_ASPCI|nr:Putative Pumilio-family RNA binding repeat domain protein [Aspergillus calidoustus]
MSLLSAASPETGRKSTDETPSSHGSADIHVAPAGRETSGHKHSNPCDISPDPLATSKLGNLQSSFGRKNDNSSSKKQKLEHSTNAVSLTGNSEMERLLAKLSPKSQIPDTKQAANEEILSKFSEQQLLLDKQNKLLTSNKVKSAVPEELERPSNLSHRTGSNQPGGIADAACLDTLNMGASEVLRLKQELQVANSRIALQEQELAQTRVIKHTLDQALGPPSEADFGGRDISEQTINNLQSAFNASVPTPHLLQDGWNTQEDSQSDISDALSAGAYNRARGGFWGGPAQQVYSMGLNSEKAYGDSSLPLPGTSFGQDSSRFWGPSATNPSVAGNSAFQAHRVLSGPPAAPCSFDPPFSEDQGRYMQSSAFGPRPPTAQPSRLGPCFPGANSPWGTFAPSSSDSQGSRSPPSKPVGTYQQVGLYPLPPYHQRAIAPPLSPTATEFTSPTGSSVPWATSSVSGSSIQTYISPLEPLNYRRLLDKNVSCDWKYIVDKIVCNNDQQASIFLQQKLKVGTTEQKFDIIEAIIQQAYSLMVNRFGNFLVQRCFEHGTPEQIIAIANAIKGNTLSLSMDPFGCHVVQKAFDCVPEEHKAIMVHELLRRILETVIHRYACHVWQKLFELRWSEEPPQIMAKVNEALRGMWHEVALGETGSLVVQNIFENCVEDEKRPAIEEVLAKIDVLAHGQFGNWCIQHICEHGAPHDKSRAIEHILHWAVEYSMDQFASKIVEKCLKIGGSEFLDRYLSRVCTGRTDRPRMPLIDIAGDQYGNYLIQWILMNAAPHQRELVATHIRKHMVSLRGSKFGSRVAMLCCNLSHTTRPGPGTGVQIGRFNNFNDDRFQAQSQHGARFGRGSQWNPSYPPFR